MEVPVPSKESEWSCICVIGVSVVPLSTILISIRCWNCSDSVVFFVFSFYHYFQQFSAISGHQTYLGSNVLQSG